ncbi:MAG: carbon dioxide transporter, partial [Cyanobacteria bacterium J083]
MLTTTFNQSKFSFIEQYIQSLVAGQALLKDTPQNLMEVVGILKSYGVVLDAY